MNNNPFKGRSIFDIAKEVEESEEVVPKAEEEKIENIEEEEKPLTFKNNPFKGRSIKDLEDEPKEETKEVKEEPKKEAKPKTSTAKKATTSKKTTSSKKGTTKKTTSKKASTKKTSAKKSSTSTKKTTTLASTPKKATPIKEIKEEPKVENVVLKEEEIVVPPKVEVNPFKGRSILDLEDEIEKEENEEIVEEVTEQTSFGGYFEDYLEEVEEDYDDEYIEDEPQYEQPQYEQPQHEQPQYEQPQYEQPQLQQVELEEEIEEEIEEEKEAEQAQFEQEVNPFKGRSILDLEEDEDIEEQEEAEQVQVEQPQEEQVPQEAEQVQVEQPQEDQVPQEAEQVQVEQVPQEEEPQIKFILVTGAFGGLGRVTMEEATRLGYAVFALDLNIDEDYVNENVMPIQCDITNERSLYQAYNLIGEYTDRLEAIINCVGAFYFDTMVEGDEEKLRKMIDINFYTVYRINQLFLPFLQKGSKIVNVTSELSSYSPQPFMGLYTISKKMLDCYTDVLRRELNYVGIKVVKIQSGSFRTGLLDKVNNEYERMYNNTEVYKKQLKKLKYMMDRELHRQHNPYQFGKVIRKILKRRNPKICYKINRSRKLRFMNSLPEKWQDRIYKKAIK